MRVLKILTICVLFVVLWSLQTFAHDTDLYMAEGQGIEPNILVLFDNSGSMGEYVWTRRYSDSTDYGPTPPTPDRDAVYYRRRGSYVFWKNDISDVACWRARDTLRNTGHYTGNTDSSCGGSYQTLWTKNYMNYIASGGDSSERKIDIAQRVMTDFLTAINGVRIGAFVFNNDEGGRLQTSVKSLTDTDRQQLITDINAITPQTWTPLGETLYEIGLYFQGGKSFFNSGVYHISPIQYSCQKNYVIVITDGNSTQDRNSVLASGAIQGSTVFPAIGDQDGDQKEPIGAAHDPNYVDNGSDYLDDVAKYLYDTDLRSDLSGKQNITTYTIGFTSGSNVDLLERTAINGHGRYYYSQDAQTLSLAFQNIIDEIVEDTSSFVAPVVPVDRMERTQSGHYIYIALFKPKNQRMWSGNIKKFQIADNGDILDSRGTLAIDPSNNHQFYDAIRSYWWDYWKSAEPSDPGLDGGDAEKGGVGGVLMNRNFTSNPRKIYTYNTDVRNSALTDASNAFTKTNAFITPERLGLGTDTSERDKLVDYVYGWDAYDEDGNGHTTDQKREWILGSFLHSKPFIVHYDSMDVIFAGANDGMLHAFNDSNGEELWGFIPPDLLNKLKALHADVLEMFVDGSPKCYISRNSDGTIQRVILIFGLRRGGNHYYALDITNPLAPQYLWEIDPEAVGSPYALMGQSWSAPIIGQVACLTGAPNCSVGRRWVAFIGGGFDTDQDLDTPPAPDPTPLGTAVYAVDIFDGSPVASFTPPTYAAMTHAIPSDVVKVDTDYDGIVERLYVGDLGGQMWRFNISDPDPNNWSASVIFTSAAGTKIFYPPDVTLEWSSVTHQGYERLFFGTGDREHPTETTVANRLYAVKDTSSGTTLTESDLYDVTSDELQQTGTTDERKTQILAALDAAAGWYIQFGSGEKVLSAAVVFNQSVNFTTYTPPPESGGDPCYIGAGEGRVYKVNYLTACAVIDFDESGQLTPRDRYDYAGSGIPSGVVIAILPNTIMEYTGIGGGIYYEHRGDAPGRNVREYWKIVF